MEVDLTSGHRLKHWRKLARAPWSKAERSQLFGQRRQRPRKRSSLTLHVRKPTVSCGARTLMANASQCASQSGQRINAAVEGTNLTVHKH